MVCFTASLQDLWSLSHPKCSEMPRLDVPPTRRKTRPMILMVLSNHFSDDLRRLRIKPFLHGRLLEKEPAITRSNPQNAICCFCRSYILIASGLLMLLLTLQIKGG